MFTKDIKQQIKQPNGLFPDCSAQKGLLMTVERRQEEMDFLIAKYFGMLVKI